MKNNEIKLGIYRKRMKFRNIPTRKQLIEQIGIEWLANRVYYVIYMNFNLHKFQNNNELVRSKWLEFTYIIHRQLHQTTVEIIQNEPKL